ncbi:hypothetical protein [Caniella muris]|uniref:hypothetical protein n=1 Tax=Caniella muris TaxID=2941502 RepID=UPI00203AC1D7|nr:hypothetical protein [Caniella muris]
MGPRLPAAVAQAGEWSVAAVGWCLVGGACAAAVPLAALLCLSPLVAACALALSCSVVGWMAVVLAAQAASADMGLQVAQAFFGSGVGVAVLSTVFSFAAVAGWRRLVGWANSVVAAAVAVGAGWTCVALRDSVAAPRYGALLETTPLGYGLIVGASAVFWASVAVLGAVAVWKLIMGR